MPKYRVTESVYLAIAAARTAAIHDSSTSADDVRKILSALDSAAESVKRRAEHIGLVNDFFTQIIEEGLLPDMAPGLRDRLAALHQEGIPLTIDDLGLSRDEW